MKVILGDFLFNLNRIIIMSDFIQLLKDRLTSPFFSTYLFSWIATNRNFLYTMLFLDENLIFQRYKLLKNEYLTQLFYNHEFITKYLWITSNICIKILSISLRFITPLIMVFIVYYIINKIERHIYKLDQENSTKKTKIKYIEEISRIDEKIKKLNKENELIEISQKVDTKKRDEEFKRMSDIDRTHFNINMEELTHYIYQWGKINTHTGKWTIEYWDVNWFIDVESENIKRTEKWKYFLKLYNQSKKKNEL